jgi:hypothetical protein
VCGLKVQPFTATRHRLPGPCGIRYRWNTRPPAAAQRPAASAPGSAFAAAGLPSSSHPASAVTAGTNSSCSDERCGVHARAAAPHRPGAVTRAAAGGHPQPSGAAFHHVMI